MGCNLSWVVPEEWHKVARLEKIVLIEDRPNKGCLTQRDGASRNRMHKHPFIS